ncbi:MAG: dihydroorotate dehydrogenase electron transfer subunit [Dehalococcoidales bacterium]|nr:dihydroorotate dehydrogenase electron transfer subunit [Dehalococcoidales bacterium]
MKLVSANVIDNREILQEVSRPNTRAVFKVHLIWLRCPEIAREAKPGQFVMVHCGEDCILPRPFSIHQVKGENIALFFTVWKDGKGTGWLSLRQSGDMMKLLGPLGNGFFVNPDSRKLLLVAGGIGIAPLYLLAQEEQKKGLAITLLYGTAYEERYENKLPLPPGIQLVSITEDGSVGKKGRVTDRLPDYIDWADQIFACGPMPMYRDMAARRRQLLKSKPVQVSLEVMMGCGRGVCYGCTVKTKQGLKEVCQDGPVFDLDDVLWDELGI